jgi:hypothetical protein
MSLRVCWDGVVWRISKVLAWQEVYCYGKRPCIGYIVCAATWLPLFSCLINSWAQVEQYILKGFSSHPSSKLSQSLKHDAQDTNSTVSDIIHSSTRS